MSVRPILPTNTPPELPFRLQRKIELYRKVGLEYIWQKERYDKTKEEVAFYQLELYDQKREKPTLLNYVHAIYRVRDPSQKNSEWLLWTATKSLLNRREEDESFTDLYGVMPDPIPKEKLDDEGHVVDRYATAILPKFDTPWNIENFQKILDSSITEVTDFFVTQASQNFYEPMARNITRQAIGNKEDFMQGTYDELYNMGFKGYSYSRSPQLAHFRAQVARERILLDNSAKVVAQAQAEEQITKKGK